MSKLVMLTGLPGSGKSMYAEKLTLEGYIIHSSDEVRKEFGDINDQSKNVEVFSILYKRVKNDLRNGFNVCIDSTNLNRKRRVAFLKELKHIPCEKVCVLIATPYERCVIQNFLRERTVPLDVLWKFYKNFHIPCKYEGWDDVIIHYPKEEYKTYYGDVIEHVDSLCNFSQDNHHHKLSLGDHMWKASDYVFKHNGQQYNSLVLAALSHDIGKFDTMEYVNIKGEPTEEAHFYQHQNVGCYKSLFFEYPKYADKEYIALLIELHMNPWLKWEQSEKAKQKDIDMFGAEFIADLLLLHDADVAGH